MLSIPHFIRPARARSYGQRAISGGHPRPDPYVPGEVRPPRPRAVSWTAFGCAEYAFSGWWSGASYGWHASHANSRGGLGRDRARSRSRTVTPEEDPLLWE